MPQTDAIIEEALNAHLVSFAGTMAIAWPNLSFDPKGKEYLRPTLLPAETEQVTLGSGGEDRHTGIYQVDVFWPAEKFGILARRKASDLASFFKYQRLTRSGLLVRVHRPPSTNPARQETGWYQIPVSIPYQCDASNGELP
jgi:hypothetical protein